MMPGDPALARAFTDAMHLLRFDFGRCPSLRMTREMENGRYCVEKFTPHGRKCCGGIVTALIGLYFQTKNNRPGQGSVILADITG